MNWGLRISNSHLEFSTQEIETLVAGHNIQWVHELFVVVSCSFEKINEIAKLSASIKFILENPIALIIDENLEANISAIPNNELKRKKDFKIHEGLAVEFEKYAPSGKQTQIVEQLISEWVNKQRIAEQEGLVRKAYEKLGPYRANGRPVQSNPV